MADPTKPDRATWIELVREATQALVHKARSDGCTCLPDVHAFPSVTNDNNVELVLGHRPGCAAYVEG